MSPSSRFLAAKMLEDIDLKKAQVIVELGPGTGVFTRKMLDKMSPEARLLIFELHPIFYENLKKSISDPRAIFINDSAEKIEFYLDKYNLGQADAVVSSLPLANFPKDLRDAVLNASYSCLKPAGRYIQFQYSLLSKKYIKRVFKNMDIKFTVVNFPPAFVYSCAK